MKDFKAYNEILGVAEGVLATFAFAIVSAATWIRATELPASSFSVIVFAASVSFGLATLLVGWATYAKMVDALEGLQGVLGWPRWTFWLGVALFGIFGSLNGVVIVSEGLRLLNP